MRRSFLNSSWRLLSGERRMRAQDWTENTGSGSTRFKIQLKSFKNEESFWKGENVRGAAQKFERSVSNEEEKKQQPVRWESHIWHLVLIFSFWFYAWSLVRSFSTQFKPAMGKSYVCILLLFSFLEIQTSVCFIPFETLPQSNYSVLIVSTLLSPSSNPRKKSSNPIKHSSILLLKINPLRFFPIISDQK